MLLTDSPSLTGNRGVYFAGASLHDSTKPWGLLVTPSQVTWEDETRSGRTFHSISYPDATNPAIQAVALVRMISHILVDRLPDRALPEILESLRSIYEFYQEPQLLPPAPQVLVSFPARFGGTYVRPTFAIAEE